MYTAFGEYELKEQFTEPQDRKYYDYNENLELF
jgi:hypothetical protein